MLTSSPSAEGNTASGVFASRWWTLRGQRSQARTQVSMRENRGDPAVARGADRCLVLRVRGVVVRCLLGREGNAEAVIP